MLRSELLLETPGVIRVPELSKTCAMSLRTTLSFNRIKKAVKDANALAFKMDLKRSPCKFKDYAQSSPVASSIYALGRCANEARLVLVVLSPVVCVC
jgi:hypothetical protein